jgi:hypothetical protein
VVRTPGLLGVIQNDTGYSIVAAINAYGATRNYVALAYPNGTDITASTRATALLIYE